MNEGKDANVASSRQRRKNTEASIGRIDVSTKGNSYYNMSMHKQFMIKMKKNSPDKAGYFLTSDTHSMFM